MRNTIKSGASDRGHGPSFAVRACLSPFSGTSGHSIQLQHAEEESKWLNISPLSSSFFVYQAHTTMQFTTDTRVSYSASLSMASPTVVPALCMEESGEGFKHSFNH